MLYISHRNLYKTYTNNENISVPAISIFFAVFYRICCNTLVQFDITPNTIISQTHVFISSTHTERDSAVTDQSWCTMMGRYTFGT